LLVLGSLRPPSDVSQSKSKTSLAVPYAHNKLKSDILSGNLASAGMANLLLGASELAGLPLRYTEPTLPDGVLSLTCSYLGMTFGNCCGSDVIVNLNVKTIVQVPWETAQPSLRALSPNSLRRRLGRKKHTCQARLEELWRASTCSQTEKKEAARQPE